MVTNKESIVIFYFEVEKIRIHENFNSRYISIQTALSGSDILYIGDDFLLCDKKYIDDNLNKTKFEGKDRKLVRHNLFIESGDVDEDGGDYCGVLRFYEGKVESDASVGFHIKINVNKFDRIKSGFELNKNVESISITISGGNSVKEVNSAGGLNKEYIWDLINKEVSKYSGNLLEGRALNFGSDRLDFIGDKSLRLLGFCISSVISLPESEDFFDTVRESNLSNDPVGTDVVDSIVGKIDSISGSLEKIKVGLLYISYVLIAIGAIVLFK